MTQATSNQKTILKTHAVDSNLKPEFLPKDFKTFSIPPDKLLYVDEVYADVNKHFKFVYKKGFTIGGVTYPHLYAFGPHWKGIGAIQETAIAAPHAISPAGSAVFLHNHVHFAQRNNATLGGGLRSGEYQCGVSSEAIAMTALMLPDEQVKFIKAQCATQMDDALGLYFVDQGFESTSMESLAAAAVSLGFKACAYRDKSVADIQQWLISKAGPVILGTCYNGMAAGEDVDSDASGAGHFVCAVGFDMATQEFLIADPYGVRKSTGGTNGWVTIFDGEQDVRLSRYSIEMMHAIWASAPDGWCVLIEPKNPPKGLPDTPHAAAVTITQEAPAPELVQVVMTCDTVFKAEPKQSNLLKANQLRGFKAGASVAAIVVDDRDGHFNLRTCKEYSGLYDWWVYKAHVKVPESLLMAAPASTGGMDAQTVSSIKAVIAALSKMSEAENTKFLAACCSEFPKFGITTKNRIIHLLAQTAHESSGWKTRRECGNGRDADGYDSYFEENYEGREDLGNRPGTRDGTDYCGRGIIQLTGRSNYQDLAKKVGNPGIMTNPDIVSDWPLALSSALMWWENNQMNQLCDRGLDDESTATVGRRINGGSNGREERLEYTRQAETLF